MFGKKNTTIVINGLWSKVEELQNQISAIKDTSIKVGDKVMLKKDMTKVYKVESINDSLKKEMESAKLGIFLLRKPTKYFLDNNKVYTSDQILPYREDSHLLAIKFQKYEKRT